MDHEEYARGFRLIGGAKSKKSRSPPPPRIPVEDPDTLSSRAFARVIDLIGEGEIEGIVGADVRQGIYLDGTPVMNANSVLNFGQTEIQVRTGEDSDTQLPLDGFPFAESEESVNVKVTVEGGPIVRRITATNVDRIRLSIGFNGLLSQDASTGDIHGTSVTYKVEISSGGGSYTERLNRTVEGKTRVFVVESVEIPLQPGDDPPYDVRVTRVTPDSTSTRVNNDMIWVSMTALTDQPFIYPNSALVGIKINAEEFQTIPERAYLVDLLKVKVPSNYNPVTKVYTGDWDGTFSSVKQWTDNPAWCLYDLLTNKRYGLGDFIEESAIDKWDLYQIAKYCDEWVETGFKYTTADLPLPPGNHPITGVPYIIGDVKVERRFVMNVYLQRQEEAFKVISELVSAFRGMAFWSAGGIGVSQDRPKDPLLQFTPANVEGGQFQYSGSSRSARHTAVMVRYSDPSNEYKPSFEYVEDVDLIEKYGLRLNNVVAVGATSRGQAQRFGHWLLLAEKLQTEGTEFVTGIWASLLRPGSIVKIVDPGKGGDRVGGRVRQSQLTSVDLDREVTLKSGETYTLSIQLPDQVDSFTIAGNSTSVTLTRPLLNDAYERTRIVVTPAIDDPANPGQTLSELDANSYNDGTKVLTFVNPETDPTNRTFEVRYPVGTLERTVTNGAGTHRVLTFAAAMDEVARPGWIWVLSTDNTKAREYQVLSVRELNRGRWRVGAVLHDPQIFNAVDFGFELEEPPDIILPPQLQQVEPPTNLKFSRNVVRDPAGARLTLELEWTPSVLVGTNDPDPNVVAYEIKFRFNLGIWQDLPPAPLPSAVIDPAKVGFYDFEVRAVNFFGRRSPPLRASFTFEDAPLITLVRVTGLELLNQGTDTEFRAPSVELVWRKNSPFTTELGSEGTQGGDEGLGDPLQVGYRVEVYDPITDGLLNTYTTPIERFSYTFDRNQEDGDGDPKRLLRFEIMALDAFNQVGPRNKITVSNPAPDAPAGITVRGGIRTIWVDLNPVLAQIRLLRDFDKLIVWVGTSQGFALDDDHIAYQGGATLHAFDAVPGTTYYVRAAMADTFSDDPTELNVGPEIAVQTLKIDGDVDIEVETIGQALIHELIAGRADIETLVVDSANIKNLAVQTVHLAGNAVTEFTEVQVGPIRNWLIRADEIWEYETGMHDLIAGPSMNELGQFTINYSPTTHDQLFNRDHEGGWTYRAGAWTLLAEAVIQTFGGNVFVVSAFGVEIVDLYPNPMRYNVTEQNQGTSPIATEWSEFERGADTDNIVGHGQQLPRVKYRAVRYDPNDPQNESLQTVIYESPPITMSATGFFFGGTISRLDNPSAGSHGYRIEMQVMRDYYDRGTVTLSRDPGDPDTMVIQSSAARWNSFFQWGDNFAEVDRPVNGNILLIRFRDDVAPVEDGFTKWWPLLVNDGDGDDSLQIPSSWEQGIAFIDDPGQLLSEDSGVEYELRWFKRVPQSIINRDGLPTPDVSRSGELFDWSPTVRTMADVETRPAAQVVLDLDEGFLQLMEFKK